MGSAGEKSSTGDVGGDGVGGLREDDVTFCAGCGMSAAAAVDEEGAAPEEITGATKML